MKRRNSSRCGRGQPLESHRKARTLMLLDFEVFELSQFFAPKGFSLGGGTTISNFATHTK